MPLHSLACACYAATDKVKNVMTKFEQVMGHERFRFAGNVELGSTLSLAELRAAHDAVALCYGADDDRTMGVVGEQLNGVHSARSFVNWSAVFISFCLPVYPSAAPRLASPRLALLASLPVCLPFFFAGYQSVRLQWPKV